MQSMFDVLGRWHRLMHVRALLTKWYDREQEVHQVRSWSFLYPELLHQERPATQSQGREERLQRRPHGKSTPKEVSKETIKEHSRSIYPCSMTQKYYDRMGSHWRSNSWNGHISERGPHTHCHRNRTRCISWQLADPFEFRGLRHDASKASTWLQKSAVYICIASSKQRIKLLIKIVRKALSPRDGNGKFPVVIPHLRYHRDDGFDTDRTGIPEKSVKRLFMCDMSLTNSDHFGNS